MIPVQIAAGVCTIVKDTDGKVALDEDGAPVRQAKYTGLHALRHFYASWCINRKVDGGLEVPAKVVQERLGHSSITVALDTYGHLFPRGTTAQSWQKPSEHCWGNACLFRASTLTISPNGICLIRFKLACLKAS